MPRSYLALMATAFLVGAVAGAGAFYEVERFVRCLRIHDGIWQCIPPQ